MGEYMLPILFLAAAFVVFGLLHGNRRGRRCGDCTGLCDKSSCDKT